jgi:competence protein ComEA
MEQPSPSWRVFDGPSSTGEQAPNATRETASSGRSSSSVRVQPLVLLALAGAVVIGAAAIGLAVAGIGGQSVAGPDGAFAALATEPPPSGGVAGEVVIDVVGAVVAPGVYRLPAGSRVEDAIQAAGGLNPRVDADRVALELNLAALLTDGAQLRVPSRDDPAPPGGGSAAGGAGSGGAPRLVDLNTATQAELEALPGIGPVTAGKIIEARTQAPFRSVDELRSRKLVGEKTFESLKALVTAG